MEISLIIMSTVLTSGRSESNFGVYSSYFRLKYLSSLLPTGLYKVHNSVIIHFLYSLARWLLTVCFLPWSVCLLALANTISTLLQVRLIHFCKAFLCKHKQNKAMRAIFMFSYPMSLWYHCGVTYFSAGILKSERQMSFTPGVNRSSHTNKQVGFGSLCLNFLLHCQLRSHFLTNDKNIFFTQEGDC